MKVIDINLLIYAINRDAPDHSAAKKWLEASLSEDEPIGLAWVVILGFMRITTNGRIMPNPLTPDVSFQIIDDWLQQPQVECIVPTANHWSTLKELLLPLGTAANLTSDAHLAALAIEYGARLYSTDNDFIRFPNLRWTNPIA